MRGMFMLQQSPFCFYSFPIFQESKALLDMSENNFSMKFRTHIAIYKMDEVKSFTIETIRKNLGSSNFMTNVHQLICQ